LHLPPLADLNFSDQIVLDRSRDLDLREGYVYFFDITNDIKDDINVICLYPQNAFVGDYTRRPILMKLSINCCETKIIRLNEKMMEYAKDKLFMIGGDFEGIFIQVGEEESIRCRCAPLNEILTLESFQPEIDLLISNPPSHEEDMDEYSPSDKVIMQDLHDEEERSRIKGIINDYNILLKYSDEN